MSDDDDGEQPTEAERPRVKQKKRVTLKWDNSELLLPGEKAPTEAPPSESGELALPEQVQELMKSVTGARHEPPPPTHDGWERERPKLTPPPPRPPSSPPGPLDEGDGDALSLVDRRGRQSSPAIDLATEMNDRFALGDYTAALRTAELLLGRHPEHAEARNVSEACRNKLAQLYQSRLGPPSRVPKVAVDPTDVRWLGLDHQAGFLLSQIDGTQTLEEISDVSGMTRLDTLKILVELLDMGAIRFTD